MKLGIEILQEQIRLCQNWGRCALLSNQASVDKKFTPTWQILQQILGDRLVSLFAPQHGFHSTVQDNMIESNHTTHDQTGIPIYSLYSETREPTEKMLENVDTIVIDIQIVGCRVYTFKYTIAGCLRAAKKYGRKVVVLDRPNPLGGILLEGPALDLSVSSFVGEFPIPMRHGLTSAEVAILFNDSIGAQLEIVALENWNPQHMFSDLNRPWVLTSPNLPTIDAVYAYPGTVLLEGTNISEGRGTGLPFQFIGAPYITNPPALIKRIEEIAGKHRLNGVFLRETSFQPTSQKHKEQQCSGFQIHVIDPKTLPSFRLGIAIVRGVIEMNEMSFQWKLPPYEYDLKTLPIKLITGVANADSIFFASDFNAESPIWYEGIAEYKNRVKSMLLYPRKMHEMW